MGVARRMQPQEFRAMQIPRAATRVVDGREAARLDRRARAATIAFWLNIAIVVGLFLLHGRLGKLDNTRDIAMFAGRLTGLLAANLCIVQVLLLGRTPVIERAFGLDRLAKWHRDIGHFAFHLIIAHVVYISIAYAMQLKVSAWRGFYDTILSDRYYLMALASLICFIAVVVTSIHRARKKLRFETWYFVHLYAYLGIALAMPHQFLHGDDFVGHTSTQVYWWSIYGLMLLALMYRVAAPIYNVLVYDMRVLRVERENHDTVSIYIQGKNIDRLKAQSGQFFYWRFLCRGHWWQSHPYSLSAAPSHSLMRITVKDLGDGSHDVAYVQPGTRVMAEGPFGAMTKARLTRPKVLLIGAGVGVTPIRALLEELPVQNGDISLIYRARQKKDVLFEKEFAQLVDARAVDAHLVLGRTSDYRRTDKPFTPGHIRGLVPDVARREIYLCGPTHMMREVSQSLRDLGCDPKRIHFEEFAF